MNSLLGDYDYEKEYDCSKYTKCNHFSKLMFLIINININSIPNGHAILRNYVSANKNEINNKNAEGWTALHIAARNSNKYHLETVKLLLENGADVNLTNENGWTALMMAARNSNTDSSVETVRLLLEKGADANLINQNGWTALMLAAVYSNTDSNTCKQSLQYNLPLQGPCPRSGRLENDDETSSLFLQSFPNSKADWEQPCSKKEHSLFLRRQGSLETMSLLLEKRADVNLVNEYGSTALMFSAYYADTKSSLETVRLLLENGADASLINKNNKTFFNYIPEEYLQKYLDIIYKIEHHKLCMKKLLNQLTKNL